MDNEYEVVKHDARCACYYEAIARANSQQKQKQKQVQGARACLQHARVSARVRIYSSRAMASAAGFFWLTLQGECAPHIRSFKAQKKHGTCM